LALAAFVLTACPTDPEDQHEAVKKANALVTALGGTDYFMAYGTLVRQTADEVTLQGTVTIPAELTLSIPSSKTLNLSESAALQINGTMNVSGALKAANGSVISYPESTGKLEFTGANVVFESGSTKWLAGSGVAEKASYDLSLETAGSKLTLSNGTRQPDDNRTNANGGAVDDAILSGTATLNKAAYAIGNGFTITDGSELVVPAGKNLRFGSSSKSGQCGTLKLLGSGKVTLKGASSNPGQVELYTGDSNQQPVILIDANSANETASEVTATAGGTFTGTGAFSSSQSVAGVESTAAKFKSLTLNAASSSLVLKAAASDATLDKNSTIESGD
jgi:hypothetical protein